MSKESTYLCILCGTEFSAGGTPIRCPACGWSPDSPTAAPPPIDPRARQPAKTPSQKPVGSHPTSAKRSTPEPMPTRQFSGVDSSPVTPLHKPSASQRSLSLSRPQRTNFETGAFCRAIPPLVDMGAYEEDRFFLLSDAGGGKFCSLAFFSRKGSEFSVTLAIQKVLGIAVLPGGDPLVVGGAGDAVTIKRPKNMNLDDPKHVQMPATRGHRSGWSIGCFALDPVGGMLAAGIPAEGNVRGLKMADFSTSLIASNLPGAPQGLAFSIDNRKLAVACNDGSILVKQVSGRGESTLENPGTPAGALAVAISRDGGWVAIFDDNVVATWDSLGHLCSAIQLDLTLISLATEPSTGRIAVGGMAGEVQVWSPDLSECYFNQTIHTDRVVRLHWIRPNRVISAGRDGEGHLFFPGVV